MREKEEKWRNESRRLCKRKLLDGQGRKRISKRRERFEDEGERVRRKSVLDGGAGNAGKRAHQVGSAVSGDAGDANERKDSGNDVAKVDEEERSEETEGEH